MYSTISKLVANIDLLVFARKDNFTCFWHRIMIKCIYLYYRKKPKHIQLNKYYRPCPSNIVYQKDYRNFKTKTSSTSMIIYFIKYFFFNDSYQDLQIFNCKYTFNSDIIIQINILTSTCKCTCYQERPYSDKMNTYLQVFTSIYFASSLLSVRLCWTQTKLTETIHMKWFMCIFVQNNRTILCILFFGNK